MLYPRFGLGQPDVTLPMCCDDSLTILQCCRRTGPCDIKPTLLLVAPFVNWLNMNSLPLKPPSFLLRFPIKHNKDSVDSLHLSYNTYEHWCTDTVLVPNYVQLAYTAGPLWGTRSFLVPATCLRYSYYTYITCLVITLKKVLWWAHFALVECRHIMAN